MEIYNILIISGISKQSATRYSATVIFLVEKTQSQIFIYINIYIKNKFSSFLAKYQL